MEIDLQLIYSNLNNYFCILNLNTWEIEPIKLLLFSLT